jgi:hypothetical protein
VKEGSEDGREAGKEGRKEGGWKEGKTCNPQGEREEGVLIMHRTI